MSARARSISRECTPASDTFRAVERARRESPAHPAAPMTATFIRAFDREGPDQIVQLGRNGRLEGHAFARARVGEGEPQA